MLVRIITNSCICYNNTYYTPSSGAFDLPDELALKKEACGQVKFVDKKPVMAEPAVDKPKRRRRKKK